MVLQLLPLPTAGAGAGAGAAVKFNGCDLKSTSVRRGAVSRRVLSHTCCPILLHLSRHGPSALSGWLPGSLIFSYTVYIATACAQC